MNHFPLEPPESPRFEREAESHHHLPRSEPSQPDLGCFNPNFPPPPPSFSPVSMFSVKRAPSRKQKNPKSVPRRRHRLKGGPRGAKLHDDEEFVRETAKSETAPPTPTVKILPPTASPSPAAYSRPRVINGSDPKIFRRLPRWAYRTLPSWMDVGSGAVAAWSSEVAPSEVMHVKKEPSCGTEEGREGVNK